MCGLAGFARHPSMLRQDICTDFVLVDLLERMERRGRHATGIASIGSRRPFVQKTADPASKALKMKDWIRAFEDLERDPPLIVIGHTRHATHQNAHVAEAAHPFIVGKVCGAHNGIIYNWREIEKEIRPRKPWINDSQAPFGLLDKYDSEQKALEKVKGYWALTWAKRGRMHLARSSTAPLACAYVHPLRTLFWCSELRELELALKNAGLTDFESWEINSSTVYRYDVTKFDEKGPNGEKLLLDIRDERASQGDLWATSGGHGYGPRVRDRRTATTGGKAVTRYQEPTDVISVLMSRIRKLEERVDELEQEKNWVWKILDENNLIIPEPESEDATEQGVSDTPYAEDVAGDPETTPEPGVCVECGHAGARVRGADGQLRHGVCVLGAPVSRV